MHPSNYSLLIAFLLQVKRVNLETALLGSFGACLFLICTILIKFITQLFKPAAIYMNISFVRLLVLQYITDALYITQLTETVSYIFTFRSFHCLLL